MFFGDRTRDHIIMYCVYMERHRVSKWLYRERVDPNRLDEKGE